MGHQERLDIPVMKGSKDVCNPGLYIFVLTTFRHSLIHPGSPEGLSTLNPNLIRVITYFGLQLMILRRSSRETSMLMEPSMACGEGEAKK